MFGFFNKAKQIKTLTGLLLSQNGILGDLVNLLKSEYSLRERTDTDTRAEPDAICGEWCGKDLGICLSVRKENNTYYASVRDMNGGPEDYRESYPVRQYKGTCYFILDSYAIFMEYDKDKKQLLLCGNLSLVRMAAETASYPAIPLDFNPN
jgi:hypothetical protein